MLTRKVLFLSAILFMFFSLNLVFASNYYIRSGATGNNTGTDWTNAWPTWPAKFVRGDTYWIASGSYPGKVFSTPAIGTAYITIRKATKESHGGDVGWDDAYDDGPAIMGPIGIYTSYHRFDGQVRGSDWKSAYGLKIKNTPGNKRCVDLGRLVGLTIRFTEIEGNGVGNSDYDTALYGFGLVNTVLEYSYLHDMGWAIVVSGAWSRAKIDSNLFARNSTSVSAHGDAWADNYSQYMTFTNNRFEDIEGAAYIACVTRGETQLGTVSNWIISGNAFYYTLENRSKRGGVGNGVITVTNWQQAKDWLISNNVFANIKVGSSSRIAMEVQKGNKHTNVRVRNNLWYDCVRADHHSVMAQGNYYFSTIYSKGEKIAMSGAGSGSPFIDADGGNFRLKPEIARKAPLLGQPFR